MAFRCEWKRDRDPADAIGQGVDIFQGRALQEMMFRLHFL